MMSNVPKRIISLFLCCVMTLSILPVVHAEELCEHHPAHGDCGYSEAVPGTDCAHSHDEVCGYEEEVEGSCAHTHDEACGYSEGTEGTPCDYVCQVCNGDTTTYSAPVVAEDTAIYYDNSASAWAEVYVNWANPQTNANEVKQIFDTDGDGLYEALVYGQTPSASFGPSSDVTEHLLWLGMGGEAIVAGETYRYVPETSGEEDPTTPSGPVMAEDTAIYYDNSVSAWAEVYVNWANPQTNANEVKQIFDTDGDGLYEALIYGQTPSASFGPSSDVTEHLLWLGMGGEAIVAGEVYRYVPETSGEEDPTTPSGPVVAEDTAIYYDNSASGWPEVYVNWANPQTNANEVKQIFDTDGDGLYEALIYGQTPSASFGPSSDVTEHLLWLGMGGEAIVAGEIYSYVPESSEEEPEEPENSVTVVVPEDFPDQEAAQELAENTAVADFTVAVPEGVTLVIEIQEIAAEGETLTLTFDVTPEDAQGNQVSLDAPITFRLPLPASVTESYAKIYHEGEYLDTVPINDEGGAKYVEFSAQDFSAYSVEPVQESAKVYYTDAASAGVPVREALRSRRETVTVGYRIPLEQLTDEGLLAISEDIVEYAFMHTGVPDEGDYLRWHCGGWQVETESVVYSDDGLAYNADLKFTFIMYSTGDQEAAVAAQVAALLEQLNPTGTDYEMIKTVYDWICENVTYDEANLYDETYLLKYSAYAALVNKTAVCQGYSNLLYRLALEMGIDCRIIMGTGNGGGHTWNIVRLGDVYYNLDATWDATYRQNGYDYAYFLRCDENFEDHLRDPEYATAGFHAGYPMAESDYVFCSHSYSKAVTAPTCEEQGYTTYTCSLCGDSFADNYVSHLGHDMGDWIVDEPPTCTQMGTHHKECSRCDDVVSAWIPALGHSDEVTYKNLTETTHDVYYACCDTLKYASQSHSYEGASRICVCGAVETFTITWMVDGEEYAATRQEYGKALVLPANPFVHGYTFSGWFTAPEGGETVTADTVFSGTDNDTVYYAQFTVNRYQVRMYGNGGILPHVVGIGNYSIYIYLEYGEDLTKLQEDDLGFVYEGYAFDGWKFFDINWNELDITVMDGRVEQAQAQWTCAHTTTKAVDNKNGTHKVICTGICGKTVTASEVHDFSGGSQRCVCGKTCNHAGNTNVDNGGCTESFTCSVCQGVIRAAAGHKAVTIPGTDATCTQSGLTDGSECGTCGEILARQETVDALGHAWGEWHVEKDPGCTTEGTKARSCERNGCTEEEAEAIPAVGHSYSEVVTAPTCVEQGYTTHTCHCGDSFVDSYVEALGHSYSEAVTEPTCTEQGYTTHTCSACGDSYVDSYVKALGHDMGSWTGVDETTERRDCTRCDYSETRAPGTTEFVLTLTDEELMSQDTVWIDGQPIEVQGSGEDRYVELPTGEETLLVTYTWHIGDETDVHTHYPTGMKVYRITQDETGYTAEHIPELDNLLQYSGSSIRIVGVKGIRMITSITKGNKSALTGEGLAGYTLEEYGTALCWATDLAPGEDLVLGKEYTRSNYAYKKGVADPIFAQTADLIQYTNVLVGFNDDQCIPDIVMRPYIILSDAEGNQVTLYGGSIYRSIGYIAWQNRNVFQPGNASYDYVWGIIHHVYGDQFDEDYKG